MQKEHLQLPTAEQSRSYTMPPEAVPVPEHEIAAAEPGRISFAGIRRVWASLRNRRNKDVAAPREELHIADVAPYAEPQMVQAETPQAVPEADAALETIESSPIVSYFAQILDDNALIAERRNLKTDYDNRTSPWITKKLADTHARLEQAEAQRNAGRAAIERRELNELEQFIGEKYTIQTRLAYMNQYRGALSVTAADERATQLVAESSRVSPDTQQYIPQAELIPHVTDPGKRILIERLKDEEPIQLPVANFISAHGMESWQQGRGTTLKRNDAGAVFESKHVVADYASRTTQAPPIEHVTGYIQPNGMVLFATEAGAHRTAAAVRRGDRTIATSALILQELDTNIVPLPESTASSGPEATSVGGYALPQPDIRSK